MYIKIKIKKTKQQNRTMEKKGKSCRGQTVKDHAFDPSTQEAEAGQSLHSKLAWSTELVPGQPGATQRNQAIKIKMRWWGEILCIIVSPFFHQFYLAPSLYFLNRCQSRLHCGTLAFVSANHNGPFLGLDWKGTISMSLRSQREPENGIS